MYVGLLLAVCTWRVRFVQFLSVRVGDIKVTQNKCTHTLPTYKSTLDTCAR